MFRSESFLKPQQKGKGKLKGKGKGKGLGKAKSRGGPPGAPSSKVDRVEEEGIARHCEVRGAHSAAITAIAMTEQGIFTASKDKSLKRWRPVKKEDGHFELQADISTPLPESCFSLLFNSGWFFCGLWDGSIRAFSQEGAEATLLGHTRRVTSLLVHQSVVISGSADQEVRLWQHSAGANTFSCTHTIRDSVPGAVTKLHVLGEYLFIGGMSGLAMCNLQSLTITRLLPPTRAVSSLLEFQGHLIVAYADGGLRVFDGEGAPKTELKPAAAGALLSIAGLESGPRVLCGHAGGQVSTIALPGFEPRARFQALEEGSRVESLLCAGHDGIFLLGSEDGTLQLWQRLAAAAP